jgi:hypothetical protein
VPGEPNKKWFDNYAFWNTTYPILPPTIGVATLDGLNEYGLPYNNTNTSYVWRCRLSYLLPYAT